MTTFSDFGLAQPLLKALAAEGYDTPTPIQGKAIPHVMEGRDLLGVAQTGTGKTAAFSLPILHRLAADDRRPAPRSCRALVLSPTRELASQIQASIRTYGKFTRITSTVIFGGVPVGRQIRACQQGVDIVVATPGRLLDVINQRALSLADVEVFILDEADQMLDMGFFRDIKKIVAMLPRKRQSLFFSATMPKEIAELAGSLLDNPVEVAVTPVASTVERIVQSVIFSEQRHKQSVLHKLLEDPAISRALVFTRTKHGADRVVRHLESAGFMADAIHGNKSQAQRERALAAFKAGRSRLLIATDIAARGIDVDGVSHVINFELPNVPESYVHRIGRTARAGADGIAISFCDRDERGFLRDIERLTRQRVPIAENPLGPEARTTFAEPERTDHTQRPSNGRGPHKADGGRPRQGDDRRPTGAPGQQRRPSAPGRGDQRRPFPGAQRTGARPTN